MTDVWTTVGVVAGVGLASATGQGWIDPLVAVAVAANILREGWHLVHRSVNGLMDHAQNSEDIAHTEAMLQETNGLLITLAGRNHQCAPSQHFRPYSVRR